MKKIAVKIFAVWVTLGIVICGADYSSENVRYLGTREADAKKQRELSNIQDDIDVVAADWAEMEKEKKKLNKDIKALEESKAEVMDFINETDKILDKLQGRIDKESDKIRLFQDKLAKLREEQEEVEIERNHKYDTCKMRLQYIYENSDESYISILLSSKNLSDFLNNMEYVERITAYDKELLQEYDDAAHVLEDKEEEVDDTYADLVYSRDLLKEDRDDVREIIVKKKKKLASYEDEIDDVNETKAEVEQKIADAEAEMEALLEEQRETVKAQIAEAGGDEKFTGAPVGAVSVAATGFAWPLPIKSRIASPFGPRVAPTAGASTFHKGVDLSASSGTKILASKAGKVVISQYSPSAGNYIGIYHGHGIYTYYMHCTVLYAQVGDYVAQGMVIAKVGSTGISTGPHLHFAINVDGEYVDPMLYISQPK
ncbi:MAG: peptidoglycan DD-metalloendopeptidase family protein [Lachnospiraceae bacterium]|nr:peptidoglycan DD-metalloendopeptidase family protein [Lachnospiraceae bacterium]